MARVILAGHAHESAAIAGTAAHLEHQIAGVKVAHELKGRETEAELVAQGILKTGASVVRDGMVASRAVTLFGSCTHARLVSGHAHESAAIAGTAAHLEHQIAGAKVAHELKGRETEAELVAQGILKTGALRLARCRCCVFDFVYAVVPLWGTR